MGQQQPLQLIPAPPPRGARRPLPKTGPPETGPQKALAWLVDTILGGMGVKDPLAQGATPATGVGALLGMASPVRAARALKRIPNPIRAYHGSPERNLKTLSPSKAMEVRGSTWLTDNPDVAEQYTGLREYGEMLDGPRGRVYEANIHAQNPMEVDMQGDVGEATRLGQLVRTAKEKGHDALVLRNVDDTVDSSRQMGTSYAVWDTDIIEILRKYGILPPIAAAAAHEATKLPLTPPPRTR